MEIGVADALSNSLVMGLCIVVLVLYFLPGTADAALLLVMFPLNLLIHISDSSVLLQCK